MAVGELVGAFEGMFYDIPIVMLIYACQIVSGAPTPHDYIDEVRWFPLSDPPELVFGSSAKRSRRCAESLGT